MITTSQQLPTGQSLMAPIDRQIICDSIGWVIFSEQLWQKKLTDCIGDMMAVAPSNPSS